MCVRVCANGPEDLMREADLKAALFAALKAEFIDPKWRRPLVSPAAAAMRAATLVGWKFDRYDHIAVPGTELEIPLSALTPAPLKWSFRSRGTSER
jgi:hypothetical protein